LKQTLGEGKSITHFDTGNRRNRLECGVWMGTGDKMAKARTKNIQEYGTGIAGKQHRGQWGLRAANDRG